MGTRNVSRYPVPACICSRRGHGGELCADKYGCSCLKIGEMSADADRRVRASHEVDSAAAAESFLLDEKVLGLVFEFMRWDVRALCTASSVNRKLRAIAKRLLWRELCVHRAPGMATALMAGVPGGRRISGGWAALAKVLFFCCGSEPTRHVGTSRRLPGHFVVSSRFSKTSGRSFLPRKCRGDLLYVSDPCEHRTMAATIQKGGDRDETDTVAAGEEEDIVGVYRGVFKEFSGSRTREFLVRRQVALEKRVCPYCGARVWSMTAAGLVPRSAARRLGSRDGRLEYFVCINGHLHGTCWLVPLSSSDDDRDDEEYASSSADEAEDRSEAGYGDGSTSSTGEEVVADGPTE